MKKLLLLVLAQLCYSVSFANPITRGEARLIAEQLIGINDHTANQDETAAEAPYYIFSRGEGQGFVIVSGDDSTAPIIGYTEQGDFIEEQLPPTLRYMLQGWEKRISQINITTATKTTKRAKLLMPGIVRRRAIAAYKESWKNVNALLKTHWHQSSPYNDLAPFKNGERCMTGCVATAGSQVIYYFRKDNPSELLYDTPTYGYGTPITESLPKGTPIEYNLMKLSGTGAASQNHAVAVLLYAAGTSAWLTYGDGDGLATSGHNYKMADAMRGQFRLSSNHREKKNYSQQAWEQMIYNNLTSRRPMLYSGVHPSNGGHSVVLDGYQASTGLFHFNFGWGGQGDGYYTVDDETGMNGFNTYQDLICDITPMKQNLAAEIEVGDYYHKATSTVIVKVKNNGTLSYSNFYIYINNKPTLPSTNKGADTETIVAPTTTATLTFNVTPTDAKTNYIFICDKSKNILDSCSVVPTATRSDLSLKSISIDASYDGAETIDGITFPFVYSTSADVKFQLFNSSEATHCQPTFGLQLDTYDRATKTWKTKEMKSISDIIMEPGQLYDVAVTFDKLTVGTLYRATIYDKAYTSQADPVGIDTQESIVYFTVADPALAVEQVIKAKSESDSFIYDINGRRLSKEMKSVRRGLYIIKEGDRTKKIMTK